MEFCCLLVYHANFIGKGTCYLGNFAIFASVFNKCWFIVWDLFLKSVIKMIMKLPKA